MGINDTIQRRGSGEKKIKKKNIKTMKPMFRNNLTFVSFQINMRPSKAISIIILRKTKIIKRQKDANALKKTFCKPRLTITIKTPKYNNNSPIKEGVFILKLLFMMNILSYFEIF